MAGGGGGRDEDEEDGERKAEEKDNDNKKEEETNGILHKPWSRVVLHQGGGLREEEGRESQLEGRRERVPEGGRDG